MIKPDFKKSEIYITILLALIGALLFISLFGHMSFNLNALQLRAAVQVNDRGYTDLEIPPLGTVRAHTHSAPVLITLSLENIDLESIQRLLAEPPERDEMIQQGKATLRRAILLFTIKLLALAVIGGIFGVFLSRRGSLTNYLAGTMAGLLLTCVLMTGTYYTYKTTAFATPQYFGVLRVAPWAISLAQETLGKIETIGEQLELVAANLNQLYEQVDNLQPMGEEADEIKILHISDLHNNPAGMDFALRVADLFEADMIIDTGDISDFGTPLETILLDRLTELNIPYLFIAGNHDSPTIVDKMSSIPEVTVVNGLLEIQGLSVYGTPDPASAGNSVVPPDLTVTRRISRQIADKLMQIPDGVDVLLLHNNKLAQLLAGYVPVVLFGHNHHLSVEMANESIMVNAGTTGAEGFRGLQAFKTPYTAALIHLRPNDDGKYNPVAVDTISVNNLEQGFALERKVFGEQSSPGEPPVSGDTEEPGL